MKIQGKKIQGPNVETIVIPRGDDDQVVFKAQAVLDFSEFDKFCPMPEPRRLTKPGGAIVHDVDNPEYRKAVAQYSTDRMAWLILKSLEATPGLEWETVVMGDHSTWGNYTAELRSAGFSEMEIGRIVSGCMSANCLSESKIEEARKRFLALEKAAALAPSSLLAEPLSTESGESANDSESGHPA